MYTAFDPTTPTQHDTLSTGWEFFPRQDNYVHPKPMCITATNFKEDLNPDKNHLNLKFRLFKFWFQ